MEKTVCKNAMFRTEKKIYISETEIANALKEIASERPVPFNERLRKIRDWAAEYLLKRGFPNPAELCFSKGQFWCPLPDHWGDLTVAERVEVSQGANVPIGLAFTKEVAEPLSPEAIVAEVCQQVFAFEKLSPDAQLSAAFEIGRLLQILSSMRHLPKVERGKKNKDGNSLGGKTTDLTMGHKKNRETVLRKMTELKSLGLNTSESARRAAEDYSIGTSKGANLQIWYRHRQKG